MWTEQTASGPAKQGTGARPSASTVISTLHQTIDAVLEPLIPAGARCALLDFPNHENVGDSAIWLGTCAWLQRRGVRVVFTCDMRTYSAPVLRRRLGSHGIILFQGGGNFGDLYPPYQQFRESVIAAFPDHRIIQLPQSMWFKEDAALDRARAVYNRHGHLVLLLRTRASLDRARQAFSAPVHLCPDMAFALGTLSRTAEAQQPVLRLLRADRESLSRVQRAGNSETVDWDHEPFSFVRALNGWMTHQLSLHPRKLRSLAGPIAGTLHPLASQRLVWGCRLLSRGRVVITDRLHGHILSVLLGIPHVLLDNSYGKVRAFFDTWTHTVTNVRWAGSEDEAQELAVQLGGASA